MISFKKLELSHRPLLEDYLIRANKQSCEYTFANLFIWGRKKIAEYNGFLLLQSQFDRKTVYIFPVGVGDVKPALDALTLLRDSFPRIGDAAICQGFRALTWEARFERLCDDPPVYFDGAHNPDGIAAAKESIMTYFQGGVILVGGILADKDYLAVAHLLSPHVKTAFTVTPKNPRALSAKAYAEAFKSAGVPAIPTRSAASALARAKEMAKDASLPVLCIGSLYLYADIRKAVKKASHK